MADDCRRVMDMTNDEFNEAIKKAIRGAFDDLGISVNDREGKAAAREDFRFMRQLRLMSDNTAKLIGRTVIMSCVAAFFAMLTWMFTNFLVNK